MLAVKIAVPIEGLGQAARLGRKQGLLTNNMAKKLTQLDTACAWLRHATITKSDFFYKSLAAEIAQLPGNEVTVKDEVTGDTLNEEQPEDEGIESIKEEVQPLAVVPGAAPPSTSLPAASSAAGPAVVAPGATPVAVAGALDELSVLDEEAVHEKKVAEFPPLLHEPVYKRPEHVDMAAIATLADKLDRLAREQGVALRASVRERQTVLDDLQVRLRRLPRAHRASAEARLFQQEVHKSADEINQIEAELDSLLAGFEDCLREALVSQSTSDEGQRCMVELKRRLDQHRPHKSNFLKQPGFGKGPW